MTRSLGAGSVPGKVFLLGEYAVLSGLPCVVAAVGPRFRAELSAESLGTPVTFHPESPAGRLLAWSEKTVPAETRHKIQAGFSFHDPFDGAGGFGASTAQFALLYAALAAESGWDHSWKAAWKLYRELTRKDSEIKSPSGADLVAQWQGGLTGFDSTRFTAEDFSSTADLSGLLIFSATGQAGRKVATHTHLDSLNADQWKVALEPSLSSGMQALRAGNLAALGRAMSEYGDALRSLGLELSSTTADRQAISAIPGVLGVKGAGAMQADSVLVLVDPSRADAREAVKHLAHDRGLKLVSDGLRREAGLEWNGAAK